MHLFMFYRTTTTTAASMTAAVAAITPTPGATPAAFAAAAPTASAAISSAAVALGKLRRYQCGEGGVPYFMISFVCFGLWRWCSDIHGEELF